MRFLKTVVFVLSWDRISPDSDEALEEPFGDVIMKDEDKEWINMYLHDVEEKAISLSLLDDPDSDENTYAQFKESDGGVMPVWKNKYKLDGP